MFFSVDDFITGSNNEHKLIYIQKALSSALNAACCPLQKYNTNLPTLFHNIENNTKEKLTLSESSSTLGLGWHSSDDTFNFPVKNNYLNNTIITKRFIMSQSHRIFDPLGF